MVAVLNVTKGKNKVIMSGLAGALSALMFLTAIHIAVKLAIIVAVTTATYALLSLIHKVAARSTKIHDISEDEGYNSVDESEEKDAVEEQKRIETELEREQKRMKEGSLGKSINAFGEPIFTEAIDAGNSNSIDYTKTTVLVVPDDKALTQNNPSFVNNQMRPLPERMDVFGNSLSGQVSSNLELESKSTQKLSPIEWLLQNGNVSSDVKKMLKQPAIKKGFNGLRS